jgi:hypothetical protein
VQALVCLVSEDSVSRKFEPLELAAALTAAVVHDVGHPGLNNQFLEASHVRCHFPLSITTCAVSHVQASLGSTTGSSRKAPMSFVVQDQLTRLFGRNATSEAMSIAIGMEVMSQPEFNFLPDLSRSESKAFATCAPVCLQHGWWNM